MLRITQNTSSAGAKSYYSTADYYTEGQELKGVWRGKGAERLGLSGDIEQKDWDSLCDNQNPQTGRGLTSRQKTERRVGYDFTWDVPKSVSLLYGLTQDERILDVFRQAVDATMQDMEAEMQTRVRTGSRNEDRTTGNLVWGEYVHTTARPVDGVPDPHLHAHCFVFNATYDEQEGRWKAGQFGNLKRDASYFEAVCHSRVAHGLAELGLPIDRTKKGWEIAGMPASTLEKFSRRTALIEAKAKESGVVDPEEKGELGAKTRDRKRKDLGTAELQDLWRSRLSDEEGGALRALAARIGSAATPEDERSALEGVERAMSHCFERRSVVTERTLLATSLKGSYGSASVATVSRKLAAQPLLRADRYGQRCVTTREVLAEERKLIAFARGGRGTCRPLADREHVFKREWLNKGQVGAVLHVLNSRDRVMLVRGAAGTGKTTMMKEAVEGIEAAGTKVFAFAPSADASRGTLRGEGFATADTVARLLLDERLQAQVRGQVVWIDEAGLLGARTMAQVFDLAERLDARVVLSGDRRQHGSVERGAALCLLEEEAGLVPAEIKEIQRQEGARYKAAVQALSEGKVTAGFRELDDLGWIREVPTTERYRMLAADYVETVAAGKTALVVCPTHREGEAITDSIRSELKQLGQLGRGEREFDVLQNANLTEAQRADPVNFNQGDVMVFHQNAKGFTKGDRVVAGSGALPVKEASRFQLFRPTQLALASGDRIRITRNGKTIEGKHAVNNGDLYTVKNFDADGNITLSNGWTLAKDYGHIAYGYAVTSHSSQGKTVQRVIIGQSFDSMPASSREQFYVSVSRGKESAVIYTDNKRELLEAVGQSDDRVTATELLRQRGADLRRLTEAGRAGEQARTPDRDRNELIHG